QDDAGGAASDLLEVRQLDAGPAAGDGVEHGPLPGGEGLARQGDAAGGAINEGGDLLRGGGHARRLGPPGRAGVGGRGHGGGDGGRREGGEVVSVATAGDDGVELVDPPGPAGPAEDGLVVVVTGDALVDDVELVLGLQVGGDEPLDAVQGVEVSAAAVDRVG